ncbi:MAG: histidine phosphatase family protein [Candidatus Paceibacterota bacterium]|jgi:broad specificity phosphatase PhoE
MVKNPKALRLKKFFQNRYFVLRHGYSNVQIEKAAGRPAKDENCGLTIEGREEVSASAQKLKKEGIDLIVASDVERARETAEIASRIIGAKIIFDKRLREFDVGDLKGRNSDKIWSYLCDQDDLANAVLPNGESLSDVQKRAYECLADLDKKYKNKTLIIISHEFPLMLLEWTLKGMELEEIVEKRCSGKIKKIGTGCFRELSFKNR